MLNVKSQRAELNLGVVRCSRAAASGARKKSEKEEEKAVKQRMRPPLPQAPPGAGTDALTSTD
jgi:hypothetical protein